MLLSSYNEKLSLKTVVQGLPKGLVPHPNSCQYPLINYLLKLWRLLCKNLILMAKEMQLCVSRIHELWWTYFRWFQKLPAPMLLKSIQLSNQYVLFHLFTICSLKKIHVQNPEKNIGPTFIIFQLFSRPYSLIKRPYVS